VAPRWERRGLTDYLTLVAVAIAAGGILAVGLVVSRWAAGRLVKRGSTPATIRAVRFWITIITVAAAALTVLFWVGPINVVSGLTFSAIVGLGVTLALQTTLANIIAGFILLQNRVLRLNDTITVSGITGRVVQIGLVTVWLRLDDGSVASMSNSTLLSGPLINRSAQNRLKGEY
jgi:small-conductance mechanosensitive channel